MKKRKKQQFPVIVLVVGGILLVIASVMLLSQNDGAGQPTALAPASSGQEETFPEIERVSLEDAKAAYDEAAAVFVDVRSAEAYTAAHIAGSVSLPMAEIEPRLGELDSDQWIITYCT